MGYKVVTNYCNCHPETCCCDDYVIINKDTKEKYCTFFSESKADEVCSLLNKEVD